jgi:hypothetical protein
MLSVTSIYGVVQITLAISVPYGGMCSERSINIHSRFFINEFTPDSEYFDAKYHRTVTVVIIVV